MTDWLLLLKIALGTVLLFDVMLLLRRPTEGAVVTTLPASEELRRKGVNMVLMPLVVTFILVLDLLQGNSPLPSLALLAPLVPMVPQERPDLTEQLEQMAVVAAWASLP